MAEIGIAASIITLLQLSAKLTSLLWDHLSKDTNEQIPALQGEVQDLNTILLELYNVEWGKESDGTGLGRLITGKDILTQWLEECRNEVQRLVEKLERPSLEKGRWKRAAAKLSWPLKRQDVEKLATLVQRKKVGVGLWIGIENL